METLTWCSLELADHTQNYLQCEHFVHNNDFASSPFGTTAAKMMIDHDLGLDHKTYEPYLIGSIEGEDVLEGVLELLQGDDISEWQGPNDDVSTYNQAPTKASAHPICVTTPSRPDPSVPSRLYNLQLPTGFVASPTQSHSLVPYATFAPPFALDGPHDGFTLSSSFSSVTAALNASTTQPTAWEPSPRPLSSALLEGYSSDPSDSRSFIDTPDVKKSTGCKRRNFCDDELTLGKNKYCKVDGGKILSNTSMVRLL